MQTPSLALEIPTPRPTLEHALWGLVAVAIAADAVTTQVGLANGLAESNPAARWVLGHGLAGFLVLKAGAVGVAAALRYPVPPADCWIAPACLAVPWLLAAVWNAALLMGVVV